MPNECQVVVTHKETGEVHLQCLQGSYEACVEYIRARAPYLTPKRYFQYDIQSLTTRRLLSYVL